MAPDNENGWAEYRRMIIDWHEQDVRDRTAIRERLEAQEAQLNERLTGIATQVSGLSTQLAVMAGVRKSYAWSLGILVPVVVSFLILGGEAVIAALTK